MTGYMKVSTNYKVAEQADNVGRQGAGEPPSGPSSAGRGLVPANWVIFSNRRNSYLLLPHGS